MKALQGRPWRKYGKIWGVRIDVGLEYPIAHSDLVRITAKSGKAWLMSVRRILEQTSEYVIVQCESVPSDRNPSWFAAEDPETLDLYWEHQDEFSDLGLPRD